MPFSHDFGDFHLFPCFPKNAKCEDRGQNNNNNNYYFKRTTNCSSGLKITNVQ